MSRFAAAALAGCLFCTLVGSSRADEDLSGQALFTSAMRDFAAKRYGTACPALRKSYRLDARPEVLYFLAQCEDLAGHVTSAAVAYDDYLALYERLPPSEQRDERERERLAVARREAIDRDIPKVTFKLPANAPDSVRVTRRLPDGGGSVDVAVGVPLPIDPGEHFVTTEAPDRATLEKRFFVQRGDQITVELQVSPSDPAKASRFSKPIAPVPTMLPPLDRGTSGQRIAAYVTGGAGILGLLVSATTGAIVWGQRDVIAANCVAGSPRLCNQQGEQASELAKSLGTVSTVTVVAGGVLLSAGVILYVTEPTPTRLGTGQPTFRLAVTPNLGGAAVAASLVW